jgi:YVTN family beta-propeller protein
MKNHLFSLSILVVALFVFIGCEQSSTPLSSVEQNAVDNDASLAKLPAGGNIVVANRASGTLSVIDVTTDAAQTVSLPGGSNPAEPMYVVFDARSNTVFVGDRANNRVIALDASSFSVKGTIPAGAGVFHMWADPRGRQLWVNNDIDKTVTVINPQTLSVITTIAIPADLSAQGGKPHDVILDPTGKVAFVSVLGLPGSSDVVVQYSTKHFSEIGRANVGKDPHLSVTQRNQNLYVPCQNSDAVYILDRRSMNVVDILSVPGAHGAGMALKGKTFYTTNLPGGGPAGLYTIDVKSNSVLGHTDAPFAVPHNIALTPNADKLYVTHSGGSADKVSIYAIGKGEQIPTLIGHVTVGLNPFGLAFAY